MTASAPGHRPLATAQLPEYLSTSAYLALLGLSGGDLPEPDVYITGPMRPASGWDVERAARLGQARGYLDELLRPIPQHRGRPKDDERIDLPADWKNAEPAWYIGVHHAAELLGFKKGTASALADRPGFPPPKIILRGKRPRYGWDRDDILAQAVKDGRLTQGQVVELRKTEVWPPPLTGAE